MVHCKPSVGSSMSKKHDVAFAGALTFSNILGGCLNDREINEKLFGKPVRSFQNEVILLAGNIPNNQSTQDPDYRSEVVSILWMNHPNSGSVITETIPHKITRGQPYIESPGKSYAREITPEKKEPVYRSKDVGKYFVVSGTITCEDLDLNSPSHTHDLNDRMNAAIHNVRFSSMREISREEAMALREAKAGAYIENADSLRAAREIPLLGKQHDKIHPQFLMELSQYYVHAGLSWKEATQQTYNEIVEKFGKPGTLREENLGVDWDKIAEAIKRDRAKAAGTLSHQKLLEERRNSTDIGKKR